MEKGQKVCNYCFVDFQKAFDIWAVLRSYGESKVNQDAAQRMGIPSFWTESRKRGILIQGRLIVTLRFAVDIDLIERDRHRLQNHPQALYKSEHQNIRIRTWSMINTCKAKTNGVLAARHHH